MSIVLKQSAGALVKPVDDARLYNLLLSDQTGIVEGCNITHLGANQLQIAAGWGICQGRMFTIEQETITASVSAGGEVNGRLLLHIDVSAATPAVFQTQAVATLPALTQEDINDSGTVYEYELAQYKVNELRISELTQTFQKIIKTEICTVILSASGWTGSGPYTQTVSAEGILGTDTPVADVQLSADATTALAQLAAWGCVSDIITADGSITARCLEDKPRTDIEVRMKIQR